MITFKAKSHLRGEFLLRHNVNKFLMHTLGNLSLFTNFNLGSKISTPRQAGHWNGFFICARLLFLVDIFVFLQTCLVSEGCICLDVWLARAASLHLP